jgi:FkbM family methyltransferase
MGEVKFLISKLSKRLISRYSKTGRELHRIRRTHRFEEGLTDLIGQPFVFVDSASFCGMYNAIFINEIYKFISNSTSPYIVDCGANVGVSVLYFKKLFPKSRLIAFEADPKIFSVLKKNITSFQLDDIQLYNKAVSKASGVVRFFSEGADGGRVLNEGSDRKEALDIDSISLKQFLDEKVDFLKIDIEGSEYEVLLDCSDKLQNVERIFIEYHSFIGEKQRLGEILNILTENGFRYVLQQDNVFNENPFWEKSEFHGSDNQLNIYAYKI